MSSLEHRALALLGIQRPFHEFSLRLRVAISQVPILLSVLMAVLIISLGSPDVFSRTPFRLGFALLVVISAAAIAVPWDRLFVPAYWAIPLLDFVVVCCLYTGGRNSVTGLSFLSAFPVFWLAWSGIAPRLGALLSFAGTLMVVWTPLFLAGQTSLHDLAGPMLIPFMMLAIFASISTVERDTTAQQQRLLAAEAKLQGSLLESRTRSRLVQAIMDTVEVGLLALDRDGEILLINSRQRRNQELMVPADASPDAEPLMFGLDRKTLLPPEDRPEQRAMRGESYSDYVVWVGCAKDQRALAVSARAVSDDDGRFNGSVLAFSDVTELVNALKTKEDFVSNVSHELRTPLTSIIGYLDLALDEAEELELTGSIPVALRVVQRNADRLLVLVSDLLTTASGSISLVESDAALCDLIRTSLDSAAPRAAAAGVQLVSDIADDLPVRVDPGRILQVLDNLLSNAIKYSPDGGTVTVRARAEDEVVVLEVQDTGMGISPLDQQEVFTKFFRTGSVRKAAIPGVGLGLVITKSIVEAHGGTITFKSELAAGTTFRVELPVRAARRVPAGR